MHAMLSLVRMLRRAGARQMDPLQVSMTGVRMGERFLQIGCSDRSLLAGLASKVGLSGVSAVATFDEASAARARAVGARVGALIDVHVIEPSTPLTTEAAGYDMVVVDDTNGGFAALGTSDRAACLRDALRTLRTGGRIEVVEGLGGGLFRTRIARPEGYDAAGDLGAAGFKPVRVLAEKDGFRFVEGLRAATSA